MIRKAKDLQPGDVVNAAVYGNRRTVSRVEPRVLRVTFGVPGRETYDDVNPETDFEVEEPTAAVTLSELWVIRDSMSHSTYGPIMEARAKITALIARAEDHPRA